MVPNLREPIWIPDCGHWLQQEEPEQVNAALIDFLKDVWTNVNPSAPATQFADYHGHGWNFRAIFKRSRDGLGHTGKLLS